MDILRLTAQIETAVAIEAKDGHLANYLADRAAERGAEFGDAQRRDALELFEDYVRSVPMLLAAAEAAAEGTPVEAIMDKLIAAAVTYWEEPDDLVPDELGVLGLLDDAYFSLRLLRLVSDRLWMESGQTLIADDLSALDDVVRDIIGDRLAQVLDELVILSLSNAPVDELIATIEEHAGSFTLASAQTSFTGLSVVELVEERLSFAARPSARLRGRLREALASLAGKLEDGLDPERIREGSATIEQEFRMAHGEDADPAEFGLAVALLVGAVVQQAALGRELDRELIAAAVDFVLE